MYRNANTTIIIAVLHSTNVGHIRVTLVQQVFNEKQLLSSRLNYVSTADV